MNFPPCQYCGAAYPEGQIGTVHKPGCLLLSRKPRDRAQVLLDQSETFPGDGHYSQNLVLRAIAYALLALSTPTDQLPDSETDRPGP